MAPLSSTHAPQVRIPATYIRGGTSKGVFFRLSDLPERCQVPGPARDALFLLGVSAARPEHVGEEEVRGGELLQPWISGFDVGFLRGEVRELQRGVDVNELGAREDVG